MSANKDKPDAAPSNDQENSESQFHLLQFESLRKEIESCIGEMRTIERYVLIGTGVVWAWLGANQQLHVHYFVWWIPVLFAILGAVRTFALGKSVQRLAMYIQQVEKTFFGNKLIGWETYITRHRKPSIRYSIYVFWAVLFIATISVPIVIKPWRQPEIPKMSPNNSPTPHPQ